MWFEFPLFEIFCLKWSNFRTSELENVSVQLSKKTLSGQIG